MKLYTNALSPFAARVRAALYFKKLHVELVPRAGRSRPSGVNTRGTRWVLIAASLVLLAVLVSLPWLLTRHAVGPLSGAWIGITAFGLAGMATGTTASTISALVAAAYPTERRSAMLA